MITAATPAHAVVASAAAEPTEPARPVRYVALGGVFAELVGGAGADGAGLMAEGRVGLQRSGGLGVVLWPRMGWTFSKTMPFALAAGIGIRREFERFFGTIGLEYATAWDTLTATCGVDANGSAKVCARHGSYGSVLRARVRWEWLWRSGLGLAADLTVGFDVESGGSQTGGSVGLILGPRP